MSTASKPTLIESYLLQASGECVQSYQYSLATKVSNIASSKQSGVIHRWRIRLTRVISRHWISLGQLSRSPLAYNSKLIFITGEMTARRSWSINGCQIDQTVPPAMKPQSFLSTTNHVYHDIFAALLTPWSILIATDNKYFDPTHQSGIASMTISSQRGQFLNTLSMLPVANGSIR